MEYLPEKISQKLERIKKKLCEASEQGLSAEEVKTLWFFEDLIKEEVVYENSHHSSRLDR